jgi:hypothetical protein
MLISQVITKAANQTLSVADVAAIIAASEGKKSEANGALGHPLQHVQSTAVQRKTAYSEKRQWDEINCRGSHSCFKTETQQAEIVRDALCSNEGKTALRELNAGLDQAKIRTTAGRGETVVEQGSLGGAFGSFVNDKSATGVVVDVHCSKDAVTNSRCLHIRSAYPVA